MINVESVLTLASELSREDAQTLRPHCAAAVSLVQAQLRSDAEEQADGLLYGTAYLALSMLPREDVQRFQAADLSVQCAEGPSRYERYIALARLLLEPFVRPRGFAFLGVDA